MLLIELRIPSNCHLLADLAFHKVKLWKSNSFVQNLDIAVCPIAIPVVLFAFELWKSWIATFLHAPEEVLVGHIQIL